MSFAYPCPGHVLRELRIYTDSYLQNCMTEAFSVHFLYPLLIFWTLTDDSQTKTAPVRLSAGLETGWSTFISAGQVYRDIYIYMNRVV